MPLKNMKRYAFNPSAHIENNENNKAFNESQ